MKTKRLLACLLSAAILATAIPGAAIAGEVTETIPETIQTTEVIIPEPTVTEPVPPPAPVETQPETPAPAPTPAPVEVQPETPAPAPVETQPETPAPAPAPASVEAQPEAPTSDPAEPESGAAESVEPVQPETPASAPMESEEPLPAAGEPESESLEQAVSGSEASAPDGESVPEKEAGTSEAGETAEPADESTEASAAPQPAEDQAEILPVFDEEEEEELFAVSFMAPAQDCEEERARLEEEAAQAGTLAEEKETEAETEEETEEEAEEETEEDLETEELLLEATNSLSLSITTSIGRITSFPSGSTFYLFLPSSIAAGKITINYAGVSAKSVTGGYKLDTAKRTITGEWKGNTTIQLTMTNGEKANIAIYRSTLPCVNIDLVGVTLATIHKNKEEKYNGNRFYLNDPKNAENNLALSDVQIKGRGNSSWQFFDKKGYNLKFDKKQSVLGMPEAKKWSLIASANDGAMMRNKLAYELAAMAGEFAFSPDGKYIDLWISGEYRGVYLITEKVEIGKNRLNLKDDKGVLVELDDAFYRTEEYWYCSSITGQYYVQKESVNEDDNRGLMSFKATMDKVESLLENGGTWAQLSALLDMRSFADFYMMNEALLNREVLCTSFFMYKDGDADKIHAGPIWDFDTCLGIAKEATDSAFLGTTGMNFTTQTPLYRNLCNYKEFVELLYEVYESNYQDKLPELVKEIDSLNETIKASADVNYKKWNVLGKTDAKGNTMLSTFKANVEYLKNWLTERIKLFVPANYQLVLDARSGNKTSRTISLQDKKGSLTSARMAVWSDAGGQDDLVWYEAKKNGDAWVITVNVTRHHSTGQFQVHAYGVKNGKNQLVSNTVFSYTPGSASVPASGGTVSSGKYASLFDAATYYKNNPDLQKAIGNNAAALYKHFETFGVREGRIASDSFNVHVYRSKYADLQRAFGGNWVLYFDHYLSHGKREGRTAGSTGTASAGTAAAPATTPAAPAQTSTGLVRNGINYSPVFDANYYLNRYADLKKAFGSNQSYAFNHFLQFGMKEGRQASANFNVAAYRARYADLRAAFGGNLVSYFQHFILHGLSEKRNGK